MLMRKGVIFAGLFLFSVIFLGLMVSAEDNFTTEKITCRFNDITTGNLLTEKTNCFKTFYFGNIKIPTEEVKKEDGSTYQTQLPISCEGIGECSITIMGEKGSKIKWSSFCMESVSDAGIKSWAKLASNPSLTTIIDGNDKTVEVECASQSFALKIFSFVRVTWGFLFNHVTHWGSRGGYALCQDGSDVIIENSVPSCEKVDNMFANLEQKCKDKCDVTGSNCGYAQASVSSDCDLDNPERNIRAEVSSVLNR